MSNSEPGHIPVLLEETLAILDPQPGEIVVDCTAGLGGHSAALARAVGAGGMVIGFDLDPANLAVAERRVIDSGGRFCAIHDSFVRVPEHLARLGLRADVVLADLGVSSTQLGDPARGFSFAGDGPLDMRLDPNGPLTAAALIASSTERELADIIFQFGEEPLARKIARKLAQTREHEPIESTAQLARLVLEAYGSRARTSRNHPATRTFMALRIAVNDELGALRGLLDQIARGAEAVDRFESGGVSGGGWLQPGARVEVISFHSLEDRLVKHAFSDLAARGLASKLTKRPVTATEREKAANPRSRSAKMRAVRIGDPNRNWTRLGNSAAGSSGRSG